MCLLLVGALHEVGAVPVPRVAAGRDGGADAGERLPALGDDGEGRRVPGRPLRADRSPTSDLWRPLVLTAGCCTLVFGGLRALRQHDLKLLLAFGTVSQLGLLMVLFGAGTPATATAGWVLLVAHAAFKAALFMVVGIIDHQTGTRDIRALPPLRDGWRGVEVVTLLAVASMAGVPLGAGFIAKELAYDSLADGASLGAAIVLAVVVAGSMLTVAYAARFYWGAFVAPRRRRRAARRAAAGAAVARRSSRPPAVLAVGGHRPRRPAGSRRPAGDARRSPASASTPIGAPVAVARLRPPARAVRRDAGRRRRAVASPTAGCNRCWHGGARSRAAPRCTSPRCAGSASCPHG